MTGTSTAFSQGDPDETVAVNRPLLQLVAEPLQMRPVLGEAVDVDVEVYNHGDIAAESVTVTVNGGSAFSFSPQSVPEIGPRSSVKLTFPTSIDGYGRGEYPILISATAVNLPVPVQTATAVTFQLSESGDAGDFAPGMARAQGNFEVQQVQRMHAETDRGQILRFTVSLDKSEDSASTLRLDLSELLLIPNVDGADLSVQYLDAETTDGRSLSFTYDAERRHILFTPAASGRYAITLNGPANASLVPTGPDDPASWTPSFNQPAVALFTGSVSYNYPILVPPGPGGFQPDLTLVYNSATSNGALGKQQSGPVGWGWNLAGEIEVSQAIEICPEDGNVVCPVNTYSGIVNGEYKIFAGEIELTLSVGGTGYELVHESGIPENGYPGRYYAEGGAGVYVEFCHRPKLNTGSPSSLCLEMDDGDGTVDGAVTYQGSSGTAYRGFWVIKTAENVAYRLGYTGDSLQQLKGMNHGSDDRMGPWSKTLNWNNPNAYPGPYLNALRWQVDEAQDRFGNTINYSYLEFWPSEVNGGWVDAHVHAPSSYLAQIEYGFNRIRFNGYDAQTNSFPIGETPGNESPPSTPPGAVSWQTHRYQTITVETQDYENPGGTYQTVRTYELDYITDRHGTFPGDNPDGLTHDFQIPQTPFCDDWPHNNLTDWKVTMLTGVTELDRNGRDILGNSGAAAVPNAEFSYQFRKTGLIDFGNLPYKYCYPHLTDVFTLYGPPNNGNMPVPTVSFEYWPEENNPTLGGGEHVRWGNIVRNMYINGGWESDAQTQRISYNYPSADYDENNENAFLGYTVAQRTFFDNGWVQYHERTNFLTRNSNTWDETLNGRIASQQIIANDGTTVLNQTTNTYGILSDFVGGSNPTKQPILQRTVSQDFINLTNNRQDFTYDVYGNQMTVQEFGDDLAGSTPIRTRETRFLNNNSAEGIQHSVYDAFAAGSFDTSAANWIITDHAAVDTIAGVPALRMWGDQGSSGVGWSHRPLRRASYNLPPGNGVSFRFRMADNHMGGRFSLETGDGGGFIGLIFYGGLIYPDYNIWINNCTDPDGVCDIGFPYITAIPQVANVWYSGEMWIDAEGIGHWNVWREDDPTQRVSFALNDEDAKAFFRGQNTRFRVDTGSVTSAVSTIYLAGYEEITPNAWLVNLPWRVSTYDGLPSANVIVNRQRMRYDGTPCDAPWAAIPTNGLLTAVDAYIPDGGNSSCGTGWLTTDISYGGASGGSGEWWQQTRSEDAGGTWTQMNWLNHTVVGSQETAVGTTLFEYNNSIPWLFSRTIAPNDSRTGYTYDTFGRLLRVTPPGPDRYQNADYAVEYQYNDGQKPLYIDEIVAPGTAAELTTRTFYDGAGRPLQQRVQGMHNDVGVIVTDTDYNGLGRATCQTAPLARTGLNFESLACTGVDHTLTQYTQLGTATAVTGVDDITSFSQRLGRAGVSLNGNKQIGIATADDLGRLIRVEEFNTTFDAFAGGTFNNSSGVWANLNPNKTAVIQEDGVDILRITGNGQWQDLSVRRQGGVLGADNGVMFRFRLKDATMQGRLGIWSSTVNPQTGNAGFLGVTLWNQTLYPEYNLGSGDVKRPGHQVPLRINEWYRAYIGIDSDGLASWYLWSEALPGDLRQQFSWQVDQDQINSTFFTDVDFDFYIQPAIGRIDLAELQEGDLYFTDYTYDLQDNLETVTDASGNETTIEYDELGRKVSMDDPDMGLWTYAYDYSSNLARQTDNLDNRLCFYYDELNRLTGKYHSGTGESACPAAGSGELLAAYTYYTSGPGLGLLHTVSGGTTPGSYSDTFTYDYRGRVTDQIRTIDGRSYTMSSTYDNLDRPVAVTYPHNETVTTTYDGQMADSLTAGSTALVDNMVYNERGQLTFMDRATVPNTAPDTAYTYANAAGNYRLEQLRHGTLADYRPDFTYSYDAIGNIVGLTTETLDGTDVQAFSYDSLNRLITSAATGGIADYTYDYTYNAIGNITERAGTGGTLTYSYGYAGKPHTLAQINGDPRFYYDANGNMINRIEDDRGYIQLFDVENRLVQVATGAVATGPTNPSIYTAPNGAPAVNNGMTSGFMDASRENSYTFTFAPGVTVSNFSLRMLDYGDYNPHLATVHTASLTAYSANGTVLATDTISYETPAENNPRSGTWLEPNPGTAVGDLYYVGDAVDAAPGEPGNYTFTVNGINISRVELSFSNDVTGVGSSDPNVGFTDLCFTSQAVGGQVCPDFSQVEAGHAIEGLGAVDPNLNISTGAGSGETTRFAYDANGQRILTIEPDGTEIYYPFAGYEEEITPGSGSQAALPEGGGVTAVASAPPQPAAPTSADHVRRTDERSLFTLFALSGLLLLLISAAKVQTTGGAGFGAPLRLTWRRHRVRAGQAISLVSLLGLLASVVLPVPVAQAFPASAPALGPVQSPWVSADIGSVGVAGSADETSGTFTLNGAGANIAGTVDAFHFVYQSLTGDGSITANAVSLSGGGTAPRAGLMMRDSLAADSAHVAAVVQGNRIRVLDRASSGGSTTEVPGYQQGAPEWLRIERSGDTFTLSRSNDGVNWSVMQTRTIAMGATIYMGMVVTGNSTTTLATGTFDNVSVSGGGPPPSCSYGPYDLSQNSRVEAENFRCGGEGVAFHEDLPADNGPGSGAYRTDVSTEGPDLETTQDVGGGYNLGWTRPGEWLEYEVIAPQAGTYDLTLRYAADSTWPFDVRLTTSQGGGQLGDSGVMSLSATGGFQVWADHVVSLPLAAGTNIVRLVNEDGRGNVNYIDMVPVSPPAPSEVLTQRITYSLGGQAVATRVVTFIDGVESSNQVYYMHGDHLGSMNVLTKMSDGYVVNDSKAYYTPFGDYRLQPTSDLTDMGYTGHLGNNVGSNDIGLIYMNARYYVPSVGRFASADTIVPKPESPQSFNRYSYVNNNPIVFTDPSGHCIESYESGNEAQIECFMAYNELSIFLSENYLEHPRGEYLNYLFHNGTTELIRNVLISEQRGLVFGGNGLANSGYVLRPRSPQEIPSTGFEVTFGLGPAEIDFGESYVKTSLGHDETFCFLACFGSGANIGVVSSSATGVVEGELSFTTGFGMGGEVEGMGVLVMFGVENAIVGNSLSSSSEYTRDKKAFLHIEAGLSIEIGYTYESNPIHRSQSAGGEGTRGFGSASPTIGDLLQNPPSLLERPQ